MAMINAEYEATKMTCKAIHSPEFFFFVYSLRMLSSEMQTGKGIMAIRVTESIEKWIGSKVQSKSFTVS